jgi:nucleoside-diphosphate-sugar epimerase
MTDIRKIVVLGGGYTGLAVARQARARGLDVRVSSRREEHARELEALGFRTLYGRALPELLEPEVDAATQVIVTFPPADGVTDAAVADKLTRAGAVTYVSSTAVYGNLRGHIDDTTPVPEATGRALARLGAESLYRSLGGAVLRCPGIYGPDRGIHVRLLRGNYLLPGDGQNVLSRIHVEDLAALLLSAASAPGETFVVGDLEPAPHAVVVRFLCERYGLPFPPSAPLDAVPETLRADRSVDGRRALASLGVTLRYPSFREGMAHAEVPGGSALPERRPKP